MSEVEQWAIISLICSVTYVIVRYGGEYLVFKYFIKKKPQNDKKKQGE